MRRILISLDTALKWTVSVLVVAILLGMVLLSFAQVVLRNVANYGLPWAEVVLRHMVLAVGMFGAVLAARQGRQISIDIFSRVVSPGVRTGLMWLGGVFTIVISVAMAKAAVVFVVSEKSFGTELAAGMKAWPFETIIPIGFALIALQVLLNLLLGRSLNAPPLPTGTVPEDTADDEAGTDSAVSTGVDAGNEGGER